jgi:vacuolar-type H+-ATPase subunit I/STV1
MRKLILVLLAATFTLFVALGVNTVRQGKQKIQLNELELKSKETQLIELNTKYDEVIQLKTNTEKEKEEQLKKIQELEQERKRLEGELQAKLQRQEAEKQRVATAARKATGTAVASAATPSSGSAARAFIFQKESGNRLDAVNSIGCYGLGQDCNGSLASVCPNWRTDRPCQESFWESYMLRRYGSWERAVAHWQARVPINGRDVGHWW